MRTLYQIHADMTTLKSRIKQLEPWWQPNDGVLLLGDTLAYLDWFEAYIADSDLNDLKHCYALQSDFDALSTTTQRLLNMSSRRCQLINDEQWVALTVSSLLEDYSALFAHGAVNDADNLDVGFDKGFDRIVTLA